MNKYQSTQRLTINQEIRRTLTWIALTAYVFSVIPPVPAFAKSSWNPTLLVSTEAFQTIDQSDATATEVEIRFGDNLGQRLYYDVSGQTFQFTRDLSVAGNITATGSITAAKILSGASIYATRSFSGAGLVSCSSASSKLLWNATTGRFSCGTDQTGAGFSTGNTLSIGDARYVKKSGDTMTGALTINLSSGFLGLNIIQMLSGAIIHAEKSLTSSGSITAVGTITARGTLSGALITQGGVPVVTTAYFSDVLDPNGIQDSTESTITFNDGSRTLTIAPVSGSFDYYLRGTKVVRSTSTGVVIPDTTGTHFIYFDSDRQLKSSTIPWSFTDNKAFVATVYWRTGGATPALLADERHGIAMDWATHRYLHNTVGTRYESGLTGTFNNNGPFTVTAGVVHDEDLRFAIPQQQNTRILYRDGATHWIADASGSLLFKETANIIQYDAGTGTPADVGTNAYVAYWVFATDEVTNPILVVMGQRTDSTLANAQANNTVSNLSLVNLPSSEMKLLYRVIYRRNGTNETFVQADDYRQTSNLPIGNFVASDHGALAGLTDDDHPQYLLLAGRGGQTITDNIAIVGTLSGSRLHAEQSLTSSGTILATGNITTRGALSGNSLTVSKNASVSGSLLVKGNLSGGTITNFGLVSCNSATQKLTYNSSTKKFECATDLNTDWSNTGSLKTAFDARYVKKSGDTMTGALTINLSSGFLGLKILQMMSGAFIHAEKSLTSSGVIKVTQRTIADSGALVVDQQANSTGAYLRSLATTQPILALDGNLNNASAAPHLMFGYKGTFDTNLFRSAAHRLQTDDSFYVVQTISGAFVHAEKTLSSSGTAVVKSGVSITQGALSPRFGIHFFSGNLLGEMSGFNPFANLTIGGLGTNGITRLTNNGDLKNIGTIQAGETTITGGGTFQAKTDFATTAGALQVAIGDLNGDGKQDMAVTNFNGGTTVSVYIATGSTFLPKVDYTAGSSPAGVAIADLNGDGKQDIVVTNHSSSNISVFINNGNGTFKTKVDYAANTNPDSVAVADFSGDGIPDLAVANQGSANVSTFIGNGDGTFQPKVDVTAGNGSIAVAMGDLNGDGRQDMAVANFTDATVSVMINTGNGAFAAKTDYALASGTHSVAIGDLNGDTKPDIVATNFGSSSVSVLRNRGDGTFMPKVDYGTGTQPVSVAIGDVNGDGRMDLAVANYNATTASVLIANPSGTFQTKVDYATNTNPRGIALGDVNGDGKLDIAVANYGSSSVSVLQNNVQPLLFAGSGSGGVVGIGTLTPNAKLAISGSVIIGNNIGNKTPKSLLDVRGIMSGTTVYATKSFSGAGLVSCSSASSKLLWNATTGQFSCGTDQTGAGFSTGNTLSIGDARYVKKSGDTMTGALRINLSSGFLGLNVLQMLSGAIIHAEKTLTSSGTILATGNITTRGTLSGNSLTVSKNASISGALLVKGNIASRATVSGAALTFMGGTSYVLGNVGIGQTSPETKLDVLGTISGSLITQNGAGNNYFMGNVGIGTISPGQKLDVAGPIAAGTTTDPSNGQDILYSRGVKYGVIGNLYSSGNMFMGAYVKANVGSAGYLSASTANIGRGAIEVGALGAGGVIRFLTGPQQTSTDGGAVTIDEKMRVDNTGNLGVGTSTPGSRLSVSGSTVIGNLLGSSRAAKSQLEVIGGISGASLSISKNANITGAILAVGNITTRGAASGAYLTFMGATSSYILGNLGVGTTNPETKLEVLGTISGSMLRLLSNLNVSGSILTQLKTGGGVLYSNTGTLATTAKGSSGQLLIAQGTSAPVWKSPTQSMIWFLDGNLEVKASQGASVTMPFGFTATSVSMRVVGAPTGAALIADLKKNGTTIFSTKPQINDGSSTGGGAASFSTTDLTDGSLITLDITQIGSTFSGSGLTLQLNGTRKY